MRDLAPFDRHDLGEVRRELLRKAECVIAMREIHAGESDPVVIGLRHDVDNTLEGAVELAKWEWRHGYRATYFILHDSPYWYAQELRSSLDAIAGMGHEIGIHANALAEALRTGDPPEEILQRAIERLRGWGHKITGVAGHGDPLCHTSNFVNDEMFAECTRPEMGEPDRWLTGAGRTLQIQPRPLSEYGLKYETYRLPRKLYLSDSGGQWNDWAGVVGDFPSTFGQLHILMHPCWWVEAFDKEVAGGRR